MALDFNQGNFNIIESEFNEAYIETLQMEVELWNANSHGTLIMSTKSILGNFETRSIFRELSTAALIKYRDPLSTADITPETLEMISQRSVKINRYSFMAKSIDSWKKLGYDPEATFSQLIGAATAKGQAADFLETMISSLVGAIGSESTMNDDLTGGKFDYAAINKSRFMFGDQFGNVKALLMSSTTAAGLADLAISEKLINVAGTTINTGTWASLGIPVMITDAEALKNGTDFNVLCLTAEAGIMVDSEAPFAYMDIDPTKVNSLLRLKRETAANVTIKGYSFTDTGISPTNATLADKTKWTKYVTDTKATAGVLLKVKA